MEESPGTMYKGTIKIGLNCLELPKEPPVIGGKSGNYVQGDDYDWFKLFRTTEGTACDWRKVQELYVGGRL